MIVVHGDGGSTDQGTVSYIQNPHRADPTRRVSYHYLIGRDGAIYRFVDEGLKAWHAGVSRWHGLEVGNSVNPCSIGVAFANSGVPSEPFREVQYAVGAELVADICVRHRIPLGLIRGHFEVSPGRKTDPWNHFDWEHLGHLLWKESRAA